MCSGEIAYETEVDGSFTVVRSLTPIDNVDEFAVKITVCMTETPDNYPVVYCLDVASSSGDWPETPVAVVVVVVWYTLTVYTLGGDAIPGVVDEHHCYRTSKTVVAYPLLRVDSVVWSAWTGEVFDIAPRAGGSGDENTCISFKTSCEEPRKLIGPDST